MENCSNDITPVFVPNSYGPSVSAISLLPRPMLFRLHKECGEPGIISHMSDVKGRKVVEGRN